jgi:hypothetical protein
VTVNGICHMLWDDDGIHLCGKTAEHGFMHLCACGASLLMGTSSLTDEVRQARKPDCPVCNARSGRPCHTKAGAVMTGIHRERSLESGAT